MDKTADLHIHTYYSDSTSSPEEVIKQAREHNLNCISITDHDTVDGIQPTMEIAEKYDIEVITGIELSSEIDGRDVHMLGYCIDHKNDEFKGILENLQNLRVTRMQTMIDKLAGLGITEISIDDIEDSENITSLGRPHLAKVLVDKGHVKSLKEAFDRYLADDAPAYVPTSFYTPYQAIDLIRRFGGVAVLAHPMFTRVDELIPSMVRHGLGGIEIMYPNTTPAIREYYTGIASKHNLLITGGSDAHGDAKKHTYIGRLSIPYRLVEELKDACA